MLFPEEVLHVLHRISVHSLQALTGEPHSYNSWSDVGKVKIEAALDESPLIFGYQSLDDIVSPFVIRDAHLRVDFFHFGFEFFVLL